MTNHLKSKHPLQHDLFLQQKMMFRNMKEEFKRSRKLTDIPSL